MRIILLIAVGCIAMLIISCSKSKDPGINDLQAQVNAKLQKQTWKTGSVTREGVDITADYTDFTLTFGKETYTTTNGSLAWPASGTWNLETGSLTKITIDGDRSVSITLSDDGKNLSLSFTIENSVYTDGRAKSLEGGYEFKLIQ
jgi:hypothetical protein